MFPTSHSLHFRVHTRVLLTVLVALAVLTLALAQPAEPAVTELFALPASNGIIEGLAGDSHGNWYFSDVCNRCVWRRTANGSLDRFTSPDDHLTGVFGLKLDERRGVLWAGTSAIAEMKDYAATDEGTAALVEFDLKNGKVRRTFPVPADGRKHVLGDVLLAPDGSVFASDSAAPVIWRLARNGTRLGRWFESAEFRSLQGMAFSADGRSLLVADYSRGLWRISLADKFRALIAPPDGAELRGLDGLYSVPGGVIAVQNGTRTQRVIRLEFDEAGRATAVRVLATGHPAMTDLALGAIAGGRFCFIADSGWSLYEKRSAAPSPRPVHILSVPL